MKDPAFLFYSSDFLTGVSDLTFEERGQYITLLCLQHQKGRLSKKAMAIAVPNATADVLHKFSIDEQGLFYNPRLEIEAEKRAKHAEKQRQRAIDGWAKRKATADATALPLEDENIDIDISINKHENFKNECLNSKIWQEQVAMTIKTHIDNIPLGLKKFNEHLITTGENKTNIKDYKSHFMNWFMIIYHKEIKKK